MLKYIFAALFWCPILLLAQREGSGNSKSSDQLRPMTAGQNTSPATQALQILAQSPEYARLVAKLDAAKAQAAQLGDDCRKASNGDCMRMVRQADLIVDSLKTVEEELRDDVERILIAIGEMRLRGEGFKRALKAFENGQLQEANRKIDAAALQAQGEALLKQKAPILPATDSMLSVISNEFALKAFLESADFEDPLRHDSAATYARLSIKYKESCYMIVGFGIMFWAHHMYGTGVEYYERALKANPTQAQEENILANLTSLYNYLSRTEEEERIRTRAVAFYQKLAKADPDRYRLEFGKATRDLGVLYLQEGKLGEAGKTFNQAMILLDQEKTTDLEYQAYMATTRMYLGDLNRAMGKMEAAEQEYLTALEIRQRVAKADPQNKVEQAYAQSRLGVIYYQRASFAEAEKMLEPAVQLLEEEVKLDPATYDFDYSFNVRYLIMALLDHGKAKEAENVCLRMREIYEGLEKEYPNAYQFRLAWVAVNLGGIQWSLQNFDLGKANYALAIDIYERLAVVDPATYEPELAQALERAANFYKWIKDFKVAEPLFERSMAIYERLAKSNPDAYLPKVAETLSDYAAVPHELGREEDASKALYRALEIYEQLDKKAPDVYGEEMARLAMNIGITKDANGQQAEAGRLFEKSYQHYGRLVKSKSLFYEPGLASSALNLALFYLKLDKFKAAEPLFLQSLEIRKRLVRENALRYDPDLALSHNGYGYYLMRTKAFPEARAEYKRAIGLLQNTILEHREGGYDYWIYPYNNLDNLRDSFALRHAWPEVVSIQRDRKDAAAAIAKALLNGDSLLANADGALAWYLLFTKEYAEAEATAEKAIALDGKQNWIRTNLGHAHLLQGNWEQAVATYESYLANASDKEAAHSTLKEDWDMLKEEKVLSDLGQQSIQRAREWLKGK